MSYDRAQGQEYQVLVVVETTTGSTTTESVQLLYGQTTHNLNFSNSLTEVEPFKKIGVVADDNVSRVTREDGKRDVTCSVTFSRPEDDADAVIQDTLFRKLVYKKDTTTTIFVGTTYPDSTDTSTILFKGTKAEMKIASYSQDFPSGSEVSGSIEFSGSGGDVVDIPETAVASLLS